jgi:hypothetical protein
MRFKTMKKIRVFLHGAAAVAIALGIWSQQELKAQEGVPPVIHLVRAGQVDVLPEDGFDAGAGLYQGIVLAGINPPVTGPPPSWPCIGGGGDATCSSIATGGFVIPYPYQIFGTNSTGEIVWTFTTTTVSGTADMKVTVTQGKKTLFSDSSLTFPVSANGTYYAYVYDVKLSGAKTGTVLVTVTTTVGTATVTGKTTLQIQ